LSNIIKIVKYSICKRRYPAIVPLIKSSNGVLFQISLNPFECLVLKLHIEYIFTHRIYWLNTLIKLRKIYLFMINRQWNLIVFYKISLFCTFRFRDVWATYKINLESNLRKIKILTISLNNIILNSLIKTNKIFKLAFIINFLIFLINKIWYFPVTFIAFSCRITIRICKFAINNIPNHQIRINIQILWYLVIIYGIIFVI